MNNRSFSIPLMPPASTYIHLLFLLFVSTTLLFLAEPSHADQGSLNAARPIWKAYKKNFIQQDGRVIDTYQHEFSHSEAQSFGLMLAQKFDDRKCFDTILDWTENNMQLRKSDHLLCWAWGKRIQGAWQVKDFNNASDGDILAAWALLEAWERWKEPSYRQKAQEIIKDIQSLLFVKIDLGPVLLPGYSGFVHEAGTIEYNSSYFIPAAFEEFAANGSSPGFWKHAISAGFSLQRSCCFSKFSLPADWVTISQGEVSLSPKRLGRYGYDAVRVWLYTSQWLEREGCRNTAASSCLENLENFLIFFIKAGWIPAEVSLKDGFVSTDDSPAGFYMVYSKAMKVKGNMELAQRLRKRAFEKINEEKNNYYSCSLFLLAVY